MDAVVSAAATPGRRDPLPESAGADRKALIPLAGRPMVGWVAEALLGSRHVDRLFVVGLDASSGLGGGPKPVRFVPAAGGLIANYVAGLRCALRDTADRRHLLVATCDTPLLTPAVVDDHVAELLRREQDLCYSVVRRETMEARYPGSGRSMVRLREGVFCSGDLTLVSEEILGDRPVAVLERFLAMRKNPLRQAAFAGLGTVLRLLTGTLSIGAIERRASAVLGIRCRVLVTPHPEVGMDVDRTSQLDLARRELERAAASPPPAPA